LPPRILPLLPTRLPAGTGRRDKTCVGGEPISTFEGADVSHSHQKLGPEDRPHTR
jgi:hypothetical protein